MDRHTTVAQECRTKLLRMKEEILNRVRSEREAFGAMEKSVGDEIDLTQQQLEEDRFLVNQERLRFQLLEIEFALARIQNGDFGICEETAEPIEVERLLALPYTRLSIEGAEIREQTKRRFARS